MKKLIYFMIVFFISVSHQTGVHAQHVEPTDSEKNESIQQQQRALKEIQSRLDYEKTMRQQKADDRLLPAIPEPKLPSVQVEEGDLPDFFIESIEFKNASKLDRIDRYRLKKPYIKQTIDLNDINQLLRETTTLYIRKGYVTSRAFLPPQNLKEGRLVIHILEGTIEDIQIENDPLGTQAMFAFPFLKGKHLNIREVEQGLDQLNRLRTNQASMRLYPGSEQGKTVIKIMNRKKSDYQISIGYDNISNRPIALYPHRFDMTRDNFLGFNDTWYIGYSLDLGQQSQFSKTSSLSGSVPFGPWLFSLSAYQSNFRNLVNGLKTRYESSGNSDSMTLGSEFTLARTKTGITKVHTSYKTQFTENFIEDYINDISSRKLNSAHLGFSQSLHTHVGKFTGSLTYNQGIPYFDGKRDANNLTREDPHAEYQTFSLDGSYRVSNFIPNHPITYQLRGKALISETALYSTERISIGDYYSVRGFQNTILQGDVGWYLRNEFQLHLGPMVKTHPWKPFFDYSSLFFGIDTGETYIYGSAGPSLGEGTGKIVGLSAGFRYYGPSMSTSIEFAIPYDFPDFVDESRSDIQSRFQVTFQLI